MDNNSKDNFINYNKSNAENNLTSNPCPVENVNAVETQENRFNPDLNYNAPVPAMNTQNSNQYPYNATPQEYYNPNQNPNSYPSSPYPPQVYPYYPPQSNPYNPPQAYPYNPNVVNQFPYNNEIIDNPLTSSRPNMCIRSMLLVMSILMFLFLIAEISVFNSLGIYYDNVFVIIDEIGILVCAILFLISFIFSCNNKVGINPIVRTVITVVVWFLGAALRGMGGSMSDTVFNEMQTKFMFLGLRSFLLFFCIPVSAFNRK